MAAPIRTFGDVRAEIARVGLRNAAVARQMGMAPAVFSHVTGDLAARPSPEWTQRFLDALSALTRGIPSA